MVFAIRTCVAVAGLSFFAVSIAPVDAANAGLGTSAEIRLEVSLEDYELVVLENGRPGPRFPISTGMPSNPTPTGGFSLREVISNPSFRPGPEAIRRGGKSRAASKDGPLGVAKIPFLGSFLIHAGTNPLSIGKPITLGCVGLTDDSMDELVAWLMERNAITGGKRSEVGQIHHRFRRSARLYIE